MGCLYVLFLINTRFIQNLILIKVGENGIIEIRRYWTKGVNIYGYNILALWWLLTALKTVRKEICLYNKGFKL